MELKRAAQTVLCIRPYQSPLSRPRTSSVLQHSSRSFQRLPRRCISQSHNTKQQAAAQRKEEEETDTNEQQPPQQQPPAQQVPSPTNAQSTADYNKVLSDRFSNLRIGGPRSNQNPSTNSTNQQSTSSSSSTSNPNATQNHKQRNEAMQAILDRLQQNLDSNQNRNPNQQPRPSTNSQPSPLSQFSSKPNTNTPSTSSNSLFSNNSSLFDRTPTSSTTPSPTSSDPSSSDQSTRRDDLYMTPDYFTLTTPTSRNHDASSLFASSNPFAQQYKSTKHLQPAPFRLNPSLGRAVDVDLSRNLDLGRALKRMEQIVARNKVKTLWHRQRFHERPGLKRKRVKREGWRRNFAEKFRMVARRVEDLRRQGW